MANKIIEALQWRYATKKFDPLKSLSVEKLEILKESFNLTATSYGLQPLKMIIVSNPEIKEKLVPITMNQHQVVDASHVLVLCTETEIGEEFIKNYFKQIEETRNTPRSILDPFETFLVDDALEGIDACPIEGFEPEKYDALLHLEELGLKSVLVLPVGYRADDDIFADLKKVRRGVDTVIIEIK
jgi:nitroreductase